MDLKRIIQIYEEQYIDRGWWGDFPRPAELTERNFDTTDITKLVPICARIAFRMIGEIPKVVLTNKAPNLLMDAQHIALNIKMLRLDIPDEIRINAFFGTFVHELGHLIYTRKDRIDAGEETARYSRMQYNLIHLVEDRRMESKLVRDFPGYHFYLDVARRLSLSIGWEALEHQVGFYGGPDADFDDRNGTDGTEALSDYICSRILYPNLLEDWGYMREVNSFPGNPRKVQEIEMIIGGIRQYADLSYEEVVIVAGQLQRLFDGKEAFCENFFLQELKNGLKGVEDFKTNVEIKTAEEIIKDLRKTLNPETFSTRSKEMKLQRNNHQVFDTIREREAEGGEINGDLLTKAHELAAKIKLSLSMFVAKMDKMRTIYEQDSGELDEDELYQSAFNRNIFSEEVPVSSSILEVVVLLDLSGSMITDDKIPTQIILSTALALAFDRYSHVVHYSVYGHRCDDNGVEITCFHEDGRKLQINRFFSQTAIHANADGYAMLYCFDKFRSDARNRLFLMISDGTPTATGYEGEDAREHVWEVVQQGKKRNIEVLSVGIDNFDQADMYDEFIPYSGPEITTKLSQWIRKKFASLADGASF